MRVCFGRLASDNCRVYCSSPIWFKKLNFQIKLQSGLKIIKKWGLIVCVIQTWENIKSVNNYIMSDIQKGENPSKIFFWLISDCDFHHLQLTSRYNFRLFSLGKGVYIQKCKIWYTLYVIHVNQILGQLNILVTIINTHFQ